MENGKILVIACKVDSTFFTSDSLPTQESSSDIFFQLIVKQHFLHFIERFTAGIIANPILGCAHRLEVPPLHRMQQLEVLELDCPYDTLSKILHSLRESHSILYKLKRVNVSSTLISLG